MQGWSLRGLLRLKQRGKTLRLLLIQGREDIGPEELGVILLLIQRQPSHLSLGRWQGLSPSGKQGGLAEACGSRDQCESRLEALVEQGMQARTPDQRPRGRRHIEFGGQKLALDDQYVLHDRFPSSRCSCLFSLFQKLIHSL